MSKAPSQNNFPNSDQPFPAKTSPASLDVATSTSPEPGQLMTRKPSGHNQKSYSVTVPNYHTKALVNAGIFTIMGSIYAEVARYDSAVASKQFDQAEQAAARAQEIIDYSQSLNQINEAQKLEIKKFNEVFDQRVKHVRKSELGDYLLPFAVGARLRQLS